MEQRRHFSIFWPVVFIAAGVLLLVGNLSGTQSTTWDTIVRLWPLLLIAGGLDGILRREGLVGAVVLIGLGVIFLLGNFGYLQGVSVWNVIIRFWPVFVIALGLDLIIGKRRPWGALVGLLAGVLLIGAVGLLVAGSPVIGSSAQVETVSQPVGATTDADGTITMVVGQMTLSAGGDATSLVSGKIGLSPNERLERRFNDSAAKHMSYQLNSEGFAMPLFGTYTGAWDLKLNPEVRLDLTANMAVGEAKIDLSKLALSRLKANYGVGRMEVTLPASGNFQGEIKGAVGELIVWVPRAAVVRFKLDTGLTTINLPADYIRNDKIVTSPNMQTAGPMMDLTLGQALGMLSVRYLP